MTDDILVPRALFCRVIVALVQSRHLAETLPLEANAQAFAPMLSGVLAELERVGLGSPPENMPALIRSTEA